MEPLPDRRRTRELALLGTLAGVAGFLALILGAPGPGEMLIGVGFVLFGVDRLRDDPRLRAASARRMPIAKRLQERKPHAERMPDSSWIERDVLAQRRWSTLVLIPAGVLFLVVGLVTTVAG